MRKIFCDCCGKEIDSSIRFEYLCHLDPSGKWNGYTDSDGQPVSGRHESRDLCLKCYNQIMSKAVSKFEELRKESTCKIKEEVK